jgi:hypothetical protein
MIKYTDLLIKAVKEGNIEQVKEALAQCADVKAKHV